jgi:transposase
LYKKGYKQIIEPVSSTKKIKSRQSRVKELKQAVGKKQMKVDFLKKLIELTEADLGIDIKKKLVPHTVLVLGEPSRNRFESQQIF